MFPGKARVLVARTGRHDTTVRASPRGGIVDLGDGVDGGKGGRKVAGYDEDVQAGGLYFKGAGEANDTRAGLHVRYLSVGLFETCGRPNPITTTVQS